ncbi:MULTISPECIES: hypothetical protein [Enterobacter]|nr:MULTISPECIES: hypothetical protein [Enterobacter]MBJ6477739.1 hypothetical protein [Enterobacter hormaechei]MCC9326954.1 hypothetical protein [Enterobacter hormaechei subsp. steigerwaltii]MCC9352656.1 hypothetical protein [Enterobacter hormaechei subsp. steigerwaltii]MCC9403324.1 hypothetical protein [Enterobacter hormaechei subsp. steigerwaltii]MCU2300381.1 hypothetical protein [Enterobacter hormaechei subsp. steigerwaltii]
MKDLIIEYRDGKFVQLAIDGVAMKTVTSIHLSHAVGENVPTLTFSGHVRPEHGKGAQKLEQVDKQTSWHDEAKQIMND